MIADDRSGPETVENVVVTGLQIPSVVSTKEDTDTKVDCEIM